MQLRKKRIRRYEQDAHRFVFFAALSDLPHAGAEPLDCGSFGCTIANSPTLTRLHGPKAAQANLPGDRQVFLQQNGEAGPATCEVEFGDGAVTNSLSIARC